MSTISAMYTNLAAQSVKIGTNTVTVYGLSALPMNIPTAKLPCRLLLPVGDMANEGRNAEFIAIGDTITVDWQIKDLMLYKPLSQDIGLSAFAPVLVDYAGAYMDMIRAFRAPSNTSHLETVSVMPGIYEYPAGSGNQFAGVMCTLLIREVITA